MFLNRNKNYRVSLEDDDQINPEEILLDSGSQYSNLEKSIPSSIFRLYIVSFGILTLILTGWVFTISITDHAEYSKLATQNKSANFPLPPPRGIITDRYNLPLVEDVPVFNILAVTRELKESGEALTQNLTQTAKYLGIDPDSFIIETLNDIRQNNIFLAAVDISKEQALAIKFSNLKGLYIVPSTKRDYLDSRKLSQILGYTGRVTKENLEKDDYYFPTDNIGKIGIEFEYEKYLRGTHGNILFSKDKDDYIAKESQAGATITLNIDHDLQIKLYDEIFEVLRESGLSSAAGVIQNPQNGEILSLVSFPDFDNDIFSSKVSIEDYKKLFESKSKPLFNRIIGGLYNPGSTIKPLMGLAGLEERLITPSTTIKDCVSITIPNQFNPGVSYTYKNWRIEYGSFNLAKAIANSCNIYFFAIGGGHEGIKGLGAEKIANYFKKSKIDIPLGIDLPGEKRGFIPTPDWKLKEKGEPWYLGDTYNTSIGQGDLLVTPLWLNAYVSAIANGGTIYKPRIVKSIINDSNKIIFDNRIESVGNLPFSKENIEIMKDAMQETIISGTAQIFNQLPVKAGAKTGTAEVIKGRSINSLFTVFLPVDNPTIAMTVLVEGSASNQGLAIRAAYNTLKWHLERTPQ